MQKINGYVAMVKKIFEKLKDFFINNKFCVKITELIANKVLLINQKLQLLRSIAHGILALISIVCLVVFGNEVLDKITSDSINNGQSLMVNIITNELFVGNLYKQNNDVEVEEKKEVVLDNIESESNISLRKTMNFDKNDNRGRISIIITDLGLSASQTEETISKIPTFIGLSFSPYAPDIQTWTNNAHNMGFEVFLNLPLQPAEHLFDDPGPYSLLSHLSQEQNIKILDKLSSISDKIVGFITKSTEIFSSDQVAMRSVISYMKEKQMILCYANMRNFSTISNLCRESQADCLLAEFILDEELDVDEFKKSLYKAQVEASNSGKVIIYVNSYPQNIEALKLWIQSQDTEKYVFVTPSSLLR